MIILLELCLEQSSILLSPMMMAWTLPYDVGPPIHWNLTFMVIDNLWQTDKLWGLQQDNLLSISLFAIVKEFTHVIGFKTKLGVLSEKTFKFTKVFIFSFN